MQKYVLVGAIVLIAALLGSYYFLNSRGSPHTTVAVTRAAIVQEASASGNVKAPTTIDLQFQSSGRIVYLGADTGDRVSAGEVLARQDTAVLEAQLQQAQASVAAEQAQLDSLKAGTRPEQIAVTLAQVASDHAALNQANQALFNAIQTAFVQSDDAIHNKADQFFVNPRTSNPLLVFSTNDSQIVSLLQSERLAIEPKLLLWQSSLSTLGFGSDLSEAVLSAQNNLTFINKFLLDANTALNNAVATAQASQTTINGWITNIALARTNITSAISGLTTAVTAHEAAAAQLEKDTRSLMLEQAGSTESTLAAQEAQVARARANVAGIEAQILQTQLISPVNGTVTAVTGNIGETVQPGTVVVAIIPAEKLQIDVNLSEDNVGAVVSGQPVSISLDAFPGATWHGVVAKIDPAQTVIGGAVYYKTTVLFGQPDERVKAGMTANVLIQTGMASSTLVVPASAVHTNSEGQYVTTYDRDIVTNQPVTLGLKSRDGMIEIRSGLSEGQMVVTASPTP